MANGSAGTFLSASTATHVNLDRPMCRHALLRSDCRVCVPRFCSHGRCRDKCKHCIRADAAKAAAAGTEISALAAALFEAIPAVKPRKKSRAQDALVEAIPAVKPQKKPRTQDARKSAQLSGAGEQAKSAADGTVAVASGSAPGLQAAEDAAAADATAGKPKKKINRPKDLRKIPKLTREERRKAAAAAAAIRSSAVKPKPRKNRPKDLRDISKLEGEERRKAVAAAAARRRRAAAIAAAEAKAAALAGADASSAAADLASAAATASSPAIYTPPSWLKV
jgi:hypothetical protein